MSKRRSSGSERTNIDDLLSRLKQSQMAGNVRQQDNVYRLKPLHYIHVLDQNTNVTRVVCGPKTFICQDHEAVNYGPETKIVVPPHHYCVVANPVQRDKDGQPVVDKYGQVKLRHGDKEVRCYPVEPFALYPGEKISSNASGRKAVEKLRVVMADNALRIRALQNIKGESDGEDRIAGDEWLITGPGTYYPDPREEIIGELKATVLRENQALRLGARKDTTDLNGVSRKTGEEWLVTEVGAYLPGVYERVVKILNAEVLTEQKALHILANRTFTDKFGRERQAGEEWLVTNKDCQAYIPDVFETITKIEAVTTLTSRQFCVVVDPYCQKTKRNLLGHLKQIKGPANFFLRPGESLRDGIEDVYILTEEEGLILTAEEQFDELEKQDGDEKDCGDEVTVVRQPGDRWLVKGPCEYIPRVEASVVKRTQAIPLDKNEGIYVRNIQTGDVRAVIGQTYMLSEVEELFEKEVPKPIEKLLFARSEYSRIPENLLGDNSDDPRNKEARDKTRVIGYRVPHNTVCQVYDFKRKKARIVFGPEYVMLGPDEQFTPLSLSGSTPKRPGVIKTLHLLLGPDFMTDIVTVESSDHARMELRVSYSWEFEVDRSDTEAAKRLFSVSDFTGDACKAMASRIRGKVASVTFDDFHRNSATIIRGSVFGSTDQPGVFKKKKFPFPANGLVIKGIDIQAVEPVDQKTRDALQRSVQLAIEITTSSQERSARQNAERLAQVAKGELEQQQLRDQTEAEKARKDLMTLLAESKAVESVGQAKAEAEGVAQANKIQAVAMVNVAELQAQAQKISNEVKLESWSRKQQADLEYMKEKNEIESSKADDLAEIETNRFRKMVAAIGPKTIAAIANSGPATQAKLLQGLGIKSTLITDGNSPINLFGAASGMLGGVIGGAAGGAQDI